MTFASLVASLYFADCLGIAAILALAFLTGLAQSQSAPTYQAVLSSIVPPRHIPNAVALNSLQFNLSRTLGPALAGVLLARAGTGVCFVVNALSFAAVIAALWRIEVPSPATARHESLARSLRAGVRHVWESPVLRALTLMGAAGSFLAYPLLTYLPVLSGDTLKSGAGGFSALLSSFGAGAIVGALVTAWRGYAAGRGRVALLSILAYGLVVFAAVHAGSLRLAAALLFEAGACLSSDWVEFYLEGGLIHGWQWTHGTFGTPPYGPLQLGGNNFYGGGTTATTNYYLDDYSLTQLDVPTGIVGPVVEIPTEFALNQNYPNPFNPTTTIKYALKENAQVTLKIYNMLGQEVRTLINARQEAGYKQVVWDGMNNFGGPVASGVYIYQIQAGSFVQAHKMILMK